MMEGACRIDVPDVAGTHASGEKTVNIVHALAKGLGDKTVGKPPTQQCGTGNGVEEPRQTGSPAVA